MLTKLDYNGVRISQKTNDALEIENKLNIAILAKRKEVAFKTEKNISLVIGEAAEELEESTMNKTILTHHSTMFQKSLLNEDFSATENKEIKEIEAKQALQKVLDNMEKQKKAKNQRKRLRKGGDTNDFRESVFGTRATVGTLAYVKKELFLDSDAVFVKQPLEEEIKKLEEIVDPYARNRSKSIAESLTNSLADTQGTRLRVISEFDPTKNKQFSELRNEGESYSSSQEAPARPKQLLKATIVAQSSLQESNFQTSGMESSSATDVNFTLGLDDSSKQLLKTGFTNESGETGQENSFVNLVEKGDDRFKQKLARFVQNKGKERMEALDYRTQDLNTIRKYVVKNREVNNLVVRGAEIEAKLAKNLLERPLNGLSFVQKCRKVLMAVVAFVTFLSIFPTSRAPYNKNVYLLRSFLGSLVFVYTTNHQKVLNLAPPYLAQYVFLGFALLCSLSSALLLKQKEAPTGLIKQAFMCLGLFLAFCWLYILSNILVAFVYSFEILFDYSYSLVVLSWLSFLSWLPVLRSFITTTNLVKMMPGYAMATFNGLFMLGLGIVVQILLYGPQKVMMWPNYRGVGPVTQFVYLIVNIFILMITFFMVMANERRFSSAVGGVLVITYLLCVVFTVVLTLLDESL